MAAGGDATDILNVGFPINRDIRVDAFTYDCDSDSQDACLSALNSVSDESLAIFPETCEDMTLENDCNDKTDNKPQRDPMCYQCT
jgi:hypothetical protein